MPILLPSKKISLSIEIGFVGYACLVISNRNSHITLLLLGYFEIEGYNNMIKW